MVKKEMAGSRRPGIIMDKFRRRGRSGFRLAESNVIRNVEIIRRSFQTFDAKKNIL